MATGVERGDGLVNLGTPLFTCELGGGVDALSTQLVEVRVTPGDELLLVVDASGVDAALFAIVWGEPALSGPVGEVSLLELEWQPLSSLPGDTLAW
ncbi:MAG TPA: hypothetical protein VNN80_24605, partial [Polyangiaceae bacterium]|nr:hypothetical protein [Polyangiaceae bacterium]